MITELVYIHRYGNYPTIRKEIERSVSTSVSRINAVHTDYKYNQRPMIYNNKGQVIQVNNNVIDILI